MHNTIKIDSKSKSKTVATQNNSFHRAWPETLSTVKQIHLSNFIRHAMVILSDIHSHYAIY